MFGFLRRIGDALLRIFKKKAQEVAEEVVEDVKESAEELVEEAIEEVIDQVKEELSDMFGKYTIEGKSHGLPRRVYRDGSVRVGAQLVTLPRDRR